MAFKEQSWLKFGRNGLRIELTVRDQDWKKLETAQFTPQNFADSIKDIGRRYGIPNQPTTKSEIDEEINWLKKGSLI